MEYFGDIPFRFGAAFLVRVGQLESQLYDACLGGEDSDESPGVGGSRIASNGVAEKEAVEVVAGGEGEGEVETKAGEDEVGRCGRADFLVDASR